MASLRKGSSSSPPLCVYASLRAATLSPYLCVQLPARRDVACNVSTTCSIFDYNLFLRLPSVSPFALFHSIRVVHLLFASLRAPLFSPFLCVQLPTRRDVACNVFTALSIIACNSLPCATAHRTPACSPLPKKTDTLTSRFRSITPISHCINPKFQGVNPKYRPFISVMDALSQNGNAVIQHLQASSQ